MKSPEFTIRKPVASDVEFIIKTWAREMRRAYTRKFPDRLFYNEFQKIILSLTSKAQARVICLSDDANYIVGFVVGEHFAAAKTLVVHFAYIRPPMRRLGLGAEACASLGYQPGDEIVATFWHPYLDRFERKDLIHNPFVLMGIKQ